MTEISAMETCIGVPKRDYTNIMKCFMDELHGRNTPMSSYGKQQILSIILSSRPWMTASDVKDIHLSFRMDQSKDSEVDYRHTFHWFSVDCAKQYTYL